MDLRSPQTGSEDGGGTSALLRRGLDALREVSLLVWLVYFQAQANSVEAKFSNDPE
jgi:hypothetical protein